MCKLCLIRQRNFEELIEKAQQRYAIMRGLFTAGVELSNITSDAIDYIQTKTANLQEVDYETIKGLYRTYVIGNGEKDPFESKEVEDPTGPVLCVLGADTILSDAYKKTAETYGLPPELVEHMHKQEEGEGWYERLDSLRGDDEQSWFRKTLENQYDDYRLFKSISNMLKFSQAVTDFKDQSFKRAEPTMRGGFIVPLSTLRQMPETNINSDSQNKDVQMQEAPNAAQQLFPEIFDRSVGDFVESKSFSTFKTIEPRRIKILLNSLNLDKDPASVKAIYAAVNLGIALKDAGNSSIAFNLTFDAVSQLMGQDIGYARFALLEGQKELVSIVYQPQPKLKQECEEAAPTKTTTKSRATKTAAKKNAATAK